MKPQVMPVTTTAAVNTDELNGDILSKSEKVVVKREPVDFSGTETGGTREVPGSRHSHHRKKMMEKWMNIQPVNGIGVGRRHLSPRNHDNRDASPRSSRSPPSPLSSMTHIPPDPRKWTSLHVGSWLQVLAGKHALVVDKSDFQMNGRALCLMKREGFTSRVPEKGAILYEDFRSRLRWYLAACRRRVRTTIANPGMQLPLKPPHFLAPPGPTPGVSQYPFSSMMQPGVRPHGMRQFSPISKLLNPQQTPVPGSASAGLHVAPSGQSPVPLLNPAQSGQTAPYFMHTAPSGHNAPLLMQSSPSPMDGQSAMQSLSGPGVARLSESRAATVASLRGPTSSITGDRNLHPGYAGSSSQASARTSPLRMAPPVQDDPTARLHGTQTTVHTTPSSLSTSYDTLHTTPSVVHSASSQSGTVSSPCPVHSSTAAAGTQHNPFGYYGRAPFVHPTPYYQFVPLYRTMRVVGHFKPIPYGYGLPNTQVPNLTSASPQRVPPHSPSQSQATEVTTPSNNTSHTSSQSQALDLSVASKIKSARSPTSASDGAFRAERESERKKIKTEPKSP